MPLPSLSYAQRYEDLHLWRCFGAQENGFYIDVGAGHPVYDIPHAGTSAAGVGFSATKFITPHWILNVDAALSQIRGSPAHSPLVERRTQRELALSVDYHW